MIYFTIPEDVISAGIPSADTDIYVDNGVDLTTNPAVRTVAFGEDYSLTIPIGSRKRTLSTTIDNRSQEDIDLIDDYFTYLEGEPVNNFHILNTATVVVVLQWNKIFRADDTYSIRATFKEVAR